MTQMTLTSWCHVATMNDLHRTSFYPRCIYLSSPQKQQRRDRVAAGRTTDVTAPAAQAAQPSTRTNSKKIEALCVEQRLFSAASLATKGASPLVSRYLMVRVALR